MSHWYVQDRLAAERRADLDRETERYALMRRAREGGGPPGWIQRIRLAIGTIRRRRLEAELKVARRHVETLERSLQTIQAD